MPLLSLLAGLALLAGLILETTGRATILWKDRAGKALVRFIYPSLIFSSLLTRFQWQEVATLFLLPLLVLVILALGWVFGKLTVKRAGLHDAATARSYVFCAIMPNYSFVPIVVANLVWGPETIPLIALASLGSDLLLWTVAFPEIAGSKGFEWKRLASPALTSLLAAILCIRFVPDRSSEVWTTSLTILTWVGRLTLPLSMFIFGTHLAKARHYPSEKRSHTLLLAWHLLVCPAIMIVMLLLCGASLPPLSQKVLLLIASMPTAIIGVVLAQLYGANSRYVAAQLLYGHIVGIVTCSLWQGVWHLIEGRA